MIKPQRSLSLFYLLDERGYICTQGWIMVCQINSRASHLSPRSICRAALGGENYLKDGRGGCAGAKNRPPAHSDASKTNLRQSLRDLTHFYVPPPAAFPTTLFCALRPALSRFKLQFNVRAPARFRSRPRDFCDFAGPRCHFKVLSPSQNVAV
jgi:hypothetical protein